MGLRKHIAELYHRAYAQFGEITSKTFLRIFFKEFYFKT